MARKPGRPPARQVALVIRTRLDELARLSSDTQGLTRLYLTPQHKTAADLIMRWMRDAGMTVVIDAVGTVRGRLEGSAPAAKTLLVGSHVDTARNAGRFDGCLGVVLAIEAAEEFKRSGKQLPFALEVVAFGDEVGVRFPYTLSGSRALAGTFDFGALDAIDSDGISLRQALIEFGCDPAQIPAVAHEPRQVLGYIEVHIEQGPLLDTDKQPLGVVTAISGASHVLAHVTGVASHAGTHPMPLRRDALAAAAEMVLAVESIARNETGLVATVGQISVTPGAINVVPGRAIFSVDIRSPVDANRRNGYRRIERELKAIARRRRCTVELIETYNQKAATCDQRFIRQFGSAIERAGAGAAWLTSGASRDGLAMAQLCPIGMLFVRCRSGLTHQPEQLVTADDIEIALRVLVDFLTNVSTTGRTIA